MTQDWPELQQFVRENSQLAFGRIVARYVNLVYSAARRQVRSEALAEDVTQAVFLILSRKAAELRENVILSAWLLRTTRYAANNAVRSERRRQKHEQEASRMRPIVTNENDQQPQWEEIAPMLDDAMDTMRQNDREALVLRFFNRHTVREVGEQLGISEDAAKQRISRAVDRLGDLLKRRGVAIGSAALAVHVEAGGVMTAPAHVAASVASASAAASSIAGGAIAAMNLLRLKALAAAALLVVGIATIAAVATTRTAKTSAPATPQAAAQAPAVPAATTQATQPIAAGPSVDDDPLATLGALSAALHNADVEAARRCVVLGDDDTSRICDVMLAFQCARNRLETSLDRAKIARFDINYGSAPIATAIDLVAMQMSSDDVRIDGDTALMPFRVPKLIIGDGSWENGQLRFMRVDGRWRLNIRDGIETHASANIVDATKRVTTIRDPQATKLLVKLYENVNRIYQQLAADVDAKRIKDAASGQRILNQRIGAAHNQFHLTGFSVDALPKRAASNPPTAATAAARPK